MTRARPRGLAAALLLAAPLLAGCASGHPVAKDQARLVPASHRAEFTGVPLLWGAYYSMIQVSPTEAVTVGRHMGYYDSTHGWAGKTVRVSHRYDARLVETAPHPASPIGDRPEIGDPVTAWGTGPTGAVRMARGRVIATRVWQCYGARTPDLAPGYCTDRGQGYTYGFLFRAPDVGPGFSGGAVTDAAGAVIGMTRSIDMRWLTKPGEPPVEGGVYAYYIGDLMADLGAAAGPARVAGEARP